MFKVLLLLFISVPLLEIYLLLQVGGIIGVWNTIGLILLTAVIGTVLLRQQGLATLARVQSQLDQNQLPAAELVEGVMLLFSGALLLTPGFFTDLIGFLCLTPALRSHIANRILLHLLQRRQDQPANKQNDIIDAEYWEEDTDRDRLR